MAKVLYEDALAQGLKKKCTTCGEDKLVDMFHKRLNEKFGVRSECKSCNNKQFITGAKRKHGDTYDYSKVEFINGRTPVTLICQIHKEFTQEPVSHLKGCGCNKCGRDVARNTSIQHASNTFISKAKRKHGDTYDYSKVEYAGAKKTVTIICNIHGEFQQTPNGHLNGNGCSKCGGVHRHSTDEFTTKAKRKHGDTYDYSKVEYVSARIDVNIICNIHGEFQQKPFHHLQGVGCKDCGYNTVSTKGRSNTEEFIAKAKRKHGDTYDYSKVEYVKSDEEVIIICPVHEKFQQTPTRHLNSMGCSRCNESKGEKAISTILDTHNVSYIQEKRFDDCRYKRSLPFDFYIPSLNICIEYDGEQHYKPTSFGENNADKIYENFNQIKINDYIKNNYCIDNGIILIRIPYTEFDNIEQILSENVLTKIVT